ncbi:alpha-ketoglutarate-dependent dioxygenase AlkB [Comamonas testosteroni]|uniref:alpha-ketoglutarate-dependent dioxygenase AlkB n=1 Tax=Comamonas testosteroni TaxID=285 RepID=UPI002DB5E193|nr:alpha-ketoglutarate-dependent dioxygenase AlkB [Comamonas testosteroni]MEB5967367.1 alpha-ketoglutarate-dependent dioxygenase AlkB [Comamonas testosteroni]
MSGDQLELIASIPAPKQQALRVVRLLGLILDQMAFLHFLSNEWIVPPSGNLLLGTKHACGVATNSSSAVGIWFDTQFLPDNPIQVWRDGAWAQTTLHSVRESDSVVSWDGPLPAFAVNNFRVSSDGIKAKLLALARNFADMDIPTQPFIVGTFSHVTPPPKAPPTNSLSLPPPNWNALRGAAAMATFALPAIDPWVELFCNLLRVGAANSKLVESLHAPWWRVALWSNSAEQEQLPGLWQAIVANFSEPRKLSEWRPKAILDDICELARDLGEDGTRLAKLAEGANLLLDDRATVQSLGAQDDFLALTLQLLLLRPSPEKFYGWRDEWPAIPPVVWWTGMTLAGYLQGYSSLPTKFRGTTECRKLLALKTWQQTSKNSFGLWQSVTPDSVAWQVDDGVIVMTADKKSWAEHKLGTRGSWYRAAFDVPEVQLEAHALAREECPHVIEQMIAIENATIQISGDGVLAVEKPSILTVRGRIELPLGQGVAITRALNQSRFKEWLATASISRRLLRPSVTSIQQDDGAFLLTPPITQAAAITSTKKPANKRISTRTKSATSSLHEPAGLNVLTNFISQEEEVRLIRTLDGLEWDQSMKRKVQHYGWRYDYKARRVAPSNYIGPLPDWADELAQRLLASGVVPELPDQVIVNNYEGSQGISKHIDCKECFRGPIVTISLLETWDMVFTRKIAGENAKFTQALPRCSAVVLDGEARSLWHHEIPSRLTEQRVPRGRRVSITFRKVAI